MISADTIVCRIPSDNAVKLEKLFCAVANPVDSADSQTWAAWAGVIVAAFAVYFAIRAWFTSIDSNKIATDSLKQSMHGLESQLNHSTDSLEKQLRHSTESLEKQLRASIDLSREERQQEQLRAYCDQLIEFGSKVGKLSTEDVDSLKIDDQRILDATMARVGADYDMHSTRLTMKWASWTFYLNGSQDALREASRKWHDYLLLAGEDCKNKALQLYVCDEGDPDHGDRLKLYSDSRANLVRVTGGLVGNYQKTWWDGEEKDSALRNIYNLPPSE